MDKATPTRKPRGFKIALIIIAVLFLLFVCTIIFLPKFLPIGTIKSIAKSKAAEMAGLDVDFQNLRFGWNGDVVLENITVAPLKDDGTPGDNLLTVDSARTNVALFPLLSGKAIVNSVEVDGFSLKVKREADGTLNLPDFSKLADQQQASSTPPRRKSGAIALSAVAAETPPAAAIPPIELHRLNLKNGILGFEDVASNMVIDVGLDSFVLEGKTLDDPFILSGRLIPYPEAPTLGDIPFQGRVAMLKNMELNLDGEASMEIDVNGVSLHEFAAKLGLGDLLASGQANGLIKAAYAERKGAVQIPEMHLTNANIGLGEGVTLDVPDTIASLNAQFDPEPGMLNIDDMSVTNDIAALRGRGRVEGINNLSDGGMPMAAIDFSGATDFARASTYLTSRNLGLDALPKLDGKGSFVGSISLPATVAGEALNPTFAMDFDEGNIEVAEPASGIVAGIDLKGISVHAAANVSQDIKINSTVELKQVPGHAVVPQLGSQPVTLTLNGGTAVEISADAMEVELRLKDTIANVPPTPWSTAAVIHNTQTRVVADLKKDVITIHSIQAKINDAIEAGVISGSVSGVLAGNPQGEANMQLSALLQHIAELIKPLIPADMLSQLTGSLRASTQAKMAGTSVEAQVSSELDTLQAQVNLPGNQGRADVQSPKATMQLVAGIDLQRPDVISIQSLDAASDGAVVQYRDQGGSAAAGQLGKGMLKAAGTVDTAGLRGEFSTFTAEVNGMSVALGQGGQQVASLAGGLMRVTAAGQNGKMVVPFSAEGDIALPAVEVGIDNVVFSAKNEQSNFGNLRAALAVDGYMGSQKPQRITLHSASLSAAPLAVNSRGALDLDSGAIMAQYAARLAPAGMSTLLGYMGLPPALLSDLSVTGSVSYNDNQVSSMGEVKGMLSVASGETSPFEMAHDLSAALNPDEQSLDLDIRRLDGNVKTAAGEAVATIAAQKSRLLLSRSGSKGFLDIRVNGSAGPTRMLVVGLTGVIPQLAEYTNVLYNSKADGVYSSWLQVQGKDESTLTLNMGGVWQGAALTIGNVPYLAEAGKLSAGMEGELAFKDNQIRLSKLMLRSDSGMMQADGQAAVTFTTDDSRTPNGLANMTVDLRFVLADLAKTVMTFPGVIPADLGLTGRIDGSLKAGGDAHDIRINESGVRFQNFRATPAPGMDLTIPTGAANFGGAIAIRPEAATGSLWDILKMVNIGDGRASLTGATLNGNAIDEMASAFSLQGGILTLQSAKVAIGQGAGGSMAAEGRIDFNYPIPQANARWSMQNLPLPIGNTPESVTMEGELVIQDNQASLPKFFVQTASGLVQASGTGNAVFVIDQSQMPVGVSSVQVGMRFALADLARLAALAPSIIPPELGLAGRMDGAFTAAGDSNDIRIGEGVVQFQGFRATPAADVPLTIPSGSANFTGSLGLNLNAPMTGSPYDALKLVNVHNGQASVTGAVLRDKTINEMGAAFQLENGVLTIQSARVSIGGGAGGNIAANGVVDFTPHAPAVNVRLAMQNIPLSEFNSEISDFMSIQSGVLNVPAQGQSIGVAFAGFSEDEILQTLRLENFSFATGPVLLHTGPVLNAELDKARAILKMDSSKDGVREISFSSITGTAVANGTGIIVIPDEAPINLIGENTADFRARGNIKSDHTMDMKVMVTGKMENVISFSLPNIIPTLRGGSEDSNKLLNSMNASAAKGDYGVHVKGNLAQPDISGIGALAGQLLKDILKSSGGQIIGGVLDLGKDTPGALLNLGGNVVEGVLNPGTTVKNAPENIIKAPENVVKGLGQAFGIGGRRRDSSESQEQQTQEQQQQDQQETEQDTRQDRRRLQLPFGIH